MGKEYTGDNVFDAAVDRMVKVYAEGHRVVCSFSGGKDSGVCMEICVIAARMTNNLPVECIMMDEEIMLPGTFEYAERILERPDEFDLHWVYANEPCINIFNREAPYFWAFDPLLEPEQWMRHYPDIAYKIDDLNMFNLCRIERFPPPEGKDTFVVMGLRTSESTRRLFGLYSSGGYLTGVNQKTGADTRGCRPIYDWSDGDVWKAHKDMQWDYNSAYDVMSKFGKSRNRLRIAPPTMNEYCVDELVIASKAWPVWFDKLCTRLPGVRQAVHFGLRSCTPQRRSNETWEQCFHRECVTNAPEWIAERAMKVRDHMLSDHAGKASGVPFPEVKPVEQRNRQTGSWKNLTYAMWGGDPFSTKTSLPYIEPDFFRPGAGKWEGKPGFQ